MASEAHAPELSALFERWFSRHTDLSLLLPFILGFAATANIDPSENPNSQDHPDQEIPSQTHHTNDRVILVNPFTQGMVVIEGAAGAASFDSLLRHLASKNGQPPASRASIEAMPSVVIGEESEDLLKEGECVICLEEWAVGGVVKEMPCKHRFHPDCIEKWLGMHGSCPVCRYKMPVDEDDFRNKGDDGETGGGGSEDRRFGREIWVTFSINGSRGNTNNSIHTRSNGSIDTSLSNQTPDNETQD